MKETVTRHDTMELSAHYAADQEARGLSRKALAEMNPIPDSKWSDSRISQFRVDRAVRELRSLLESGVSPHVMGCIVRALRELE